MTSGKDTPKETPFHEGELYMQNLMGVTERVAMFANRAVRSYLPNQHRMFFRQLPLILLGGLDEDGWPRATMLAGEPGFAFSPDPSCFEINAHVLTGDPFKSVLREGNPIGALGLEFGTRRRNRFTAHVANLSDGKIELNIDSSFGNCPRFIQTRDLEFVRDPRDAMFMPDIECFSSFDSSAHNVIATADTFFVATATAPGENRIQYGADVSHRGGKSGFIRLDSDTELTIPDFSGNMHFNTVGNLLLNPRCSLFFPDFQTGDMLFLAGEMAIDLTSEEIPLFYGAERLMRFKLDHAIRLKAALPFRFTFGDYSPFSLMTGNWPDA